MQRISIVLLAVSILVTTACAPRMVQTITGTEDQVKMIYTREHPFSPETGVIQCAREEDGTLKDCAYMTINFDDGKAQ